MNADRQQYTHGEDNSEPTSKPGSTATKAQFALRMALESPNKRDPARDASVPPGGSLRVQAVESRDIELNRFAVGKNELPLARRPPWLFSFSSRASSLCPLISAGML
jgi:hypothetical protein